MNVKKKNEKMVIRKYEVMNKIEDRMDKVVSWILSFFVLIALLAILGNQLICLTDLEFDYINPYDSASRINYMFLPESITQGVLCLMYLVTGHWSMLLLSLPYLYYNVRLYLQKKHLVDVTEIYNQLNWEKKQRLYKLFYVISLLVLSLFRLLRSVGEDDG